MEWSPRRRIAAICALLLSVCRVWGSPNSCGDGSSEYMPASSQPPGFSRPASSPSSGFISTSSSNFASSATSNTGSTSTCDCPSPSSLVKVSGGAGAEGSSSFEFDGLTPDIARQLYDRYAAGDEVDQITLDAIPGAVRDRLENLSLTFSDIPGLMQRAVLWDSGYAVTSDNRAVQVWTMDNRAMADIAVSAMEFSATGCEPQSCVQLNGEVTQTYKTCPRGPIDILAASKCVVEAFQSDSGDTNSTMWSISGNMSIPEIRVVKSAGVDECGCEYTVYSVHTAASATQSDGCSPGESSGSLTIPCFGSDSVPDAINTRLSTPQETDWVTEWISRDARPRTTAESSGPSSQGSESATTEAGENGGGGFSLWWLLLILLITLLVIIATIVACRHYHRLSRFSSPPDTTYIFVGGRMWAVEDESHGRGASYWLRFANWCRKTFNFFE